MSDVARAAGVSLGTVSNVLNGTAKVSPQTRDRVETVIRDLGFVRNGAARYLAAGTSSTIGFVVIDLSNSFFLDMARGAEEVAGAVAMNVLLANSDLSPEKEHTYVRLFDEERVAGILLASGPGSAAAALTSRPHGRPMVFLNDPAIGASACSVTSDNVTGGYLAARHLIELGRRRLLFAGTTVLPAVHDRLTGVERAVREAGAPVTLERLETPGVNAEDGRVVGRAIVERRSTERPDGVVAAADLLAFGVIQALLLGSSLRPPDDIAVIGYDDNRAAGSSVIPISTIRQPGTEMGRVATHLLLDEVRRPGEHGHEARTLLPEVVARESTVGRHP
jgi:LacI family transcriptional regulator